MHNMVAQTVGHFAGTQPWPRHCWVGSTPLWEWLLSHWDVTGLLKAIFVCNPLDWTEMSCESHLNMHFICQPQGSSEVWCVLTAFLQRPCHGNASGKAALHVFPSQKKAAQGILALLSGDCSEFPHWLYLGSWQGHQHRPPQLLLLPSPAVGFHSSHGYFMGIFQLSLLCQHFHPLSQMNEPKSHFMSWGPSYSDLNLPSAGLGTPSVRVGTAKLLKSPQAWRFKEKQNKFQDHLNVLGSESRVGCRIQGVSVAH